jgi:hypothetical protein
MKKWWQEYFKDLDFKAVSSLVKEYGTSGDHNLLASSYILEHASLIRLAFASIIGTNQDPSDHPIPQKAIISKTHFGLPRGRPQTSIWAFWTAYFLRQQIKINNKQPAHAFLTKLLNVFLRTNLTEAKVRSQLYEIRKQAKKIAIEAGEEHIDEVLRKGAHPKDIANEFKTSINTFIEPHHNYPPIIIDGKVNGIWLSKLLKARKSILDLVQRKGLLGGYEPLVLISKITTLTPAIPAKGFNFNATREDGYYHFGKAMRFPVSPPLFCRYGGNVSISQNKDGTSQVGIGIPPDLLDKDQPYVTALFSVPLWWIEWQKLFQPHE